MAPRWFATLSFLAFYRDCVVFQLDHFTCFYLAKGHQTPRSTGTRWYDHNDLHSLEPLLVFSLVSFVRNVVVDLRMLMPVG